MSLVIVTDTYSDHDMQCPAEWENGFKEGRVTRFGNAERGLSHMWSGEWQGSSYQFQISDYDHRFRRQLASFEDRYWSLPLTIRMTTRRNRAELGDPYTVFVGPIVNAQPINPLLWDITLSDIVTESLLRERDNLVLPWRRIGDSGFVTGSPMVLDAISELLDLDTPEPIVYGEHRRVPDSPLTPEGFRIQPTYLGLWTPSATQYHVWIVAGHALKEIINITVDDDPRAEGDGWLISTQAGFIAEFGTGYVDIPDVFGTDRRYALILGEVGSSFGGEADDVALGEKVLKAQVLGVEFIGDGSGEMITDIYQQYSHFLMNFVARQGRNSYMSGDWLGNPQWDLFEGLIDIVDEESFTLASDIALERFPTTGYIGAAVIGRQAGDRFSARKWIADWNRSSGARFGITRRGQMKIAILHPTEEARAAAPLYTDAYEVLRGSFGTDVRWGEHATTIQYRTDYEPVSGVWKTSGAISDNETIEAYGRDINSEPREYIFAPGIVNATHLAVLEGRVRKYPPRVIQFEGSVGPDPVTGDSIGYLELGDYIRYIHFDAVSQSRFERLAQVEWMQVQTGTRRIAIRAIDVEDLVGYDVGGSPGGSWGGSPV